MRPVASVVHLDLRGHLLVDPLLYLDLVRRQVAPVAAPGSTPREDGVEKDATHVEAATAGAHGEEHCHGGLGLLHLRRVVLLFVISLLFLFIILDLIQLLGCKVLIIFSQLIA